MLPNPNTFRDASRRNVAFTTFVALVLVFCVGMPGCQKAHDQKSDGRPTVQKKLPRLVDLGAGKCIPCKKMAPILEELKDEYSSSLEVVFIDVWQNKQAGDEYGIQSIPTQIFYDVDGKEVFRHEGFISKEDILQKWKEFGVDL